jgi:hypothetical protein
MANPPAGSGHPATDLPPADSASVPPLLEQELEKLRQMLRDPAERRAAERWPVDWPLEGWLQLEEGDGALIPVKLANLSCSGTAVVLEGDHGLRTGQRGRLITQAHGAGCGERAVRCCWLRSEEGLQTAGLIFEPGADS